MADGTELQLPRIEVDAGAQAEIAAMSPSEQQQFQNFIELEVAPEFGVQPGQISESLTQQAPTLNVEPEAFSTDINQPLTVEDVEAPSSVQLDEDLTLGLDQQTIDTLPVPLTREQIQNVGSRNTEAIIDSSRRASVYETNPRKAQRPLRERESYSDHFDYSIQKGKGGQVSAMVSATGSVSKGQRVGKTEPQEIKITDAHMQSLFSQATRFAANYSRMTPMQQTIGSLQLFTNAVRPYFQVERDEAGNVTRGIPEAAAVANIVDSLSIYNQWGRLSNVGKFRQTANQMINLADELGYGDLVGSTPRNGLALINFGYAAHNLLNNWDNMSAGERTIGTLHVINQGAQAYSAGQAVLTNLQGSAAAGSSVPTGTILENFGFGNTAAEGTVVITEGATEAGTTAAAETFGSQALQYAGYAAAAYAAYSMVDNWGQGGNAGSRASQASNGAAIGSMFGPWGAAIGAVIGLAIGSINAGKSGPQQKRDSLRGVMINNNIFQKQEDGRVTTNLADGSMYDVGVDGARSTAKMADGSVKTYANPDRIAERDKSHVLNGNQLRPYDIDYTNDLDYITSLATKAANLFPVGGSMARRTSEVDQINGLLTNAATSNAGREWTEENFQKVMGNVRGFYKNMGITSADEGMKILNEMRDNKRISKDDYNAMVMGIDFAFNSDFERATQLLKDLNRDEAPVNVSEEEFKKLKEEDLRDLSQSRGA